MFYCTHARLLNTFNYYVCSVPCGGVPSTPPISTLWANLYLFSFSYNIIHLIKPQLMYISLLLRRGSSETYIAEQLCNPMINVGHVTINLQKCYHLNVAWCNSAVAVTPRKQLILIGKPICLECYSTTPPMWTKDRYILQTFSKRGEYYYYRKDNATEADTGVYYCTVRSKEKKESDYGQVYVASGTSISLLSVNDCY